MPIGAVIGGAVIAGGATIASGAMASHAQSHAADSAAATQQAVATQNNQLARDMYASNSARLDPYSHAGMAAGDEYMGLLLGDAPKTAGTGSGWLPVAGTATPAPTTTTAHPGTTTTLTTTSHSTGALGALIAKDMGVQYGAPAPALGTAATPVNSAAAPSALGAFGGGSTIAQQAQAAIAAGADPAAVRARAASMGVTI